MAAPTTTNVPARLRRAVAGPWGLAGAGALLLVAVIAVGTGFGIEFPTSLRVPVGERVDAVDAWVVRNRGDNWLFIGVFGPITTLIQTLLAELNAWLDLLGWAGTMVLLGTIAWLSGGWRVMAVTWACLATIGFIGVWDDAMRTLSLMSTAVLIALLIALPLGVWAGRDRRVDAALRPLLDTLQTTPAYVYLLPLVLLFRTGDASAVIATVIYALPPAVRLTALGIRTTPESLLEVSRSTGATRRQLLTSVQLPAAMPSIRVGVNQTIMMALAMVVIGSLIGGTGLGRGVLNGLQRVDVGRALEPGVAIVLIAVLLDRITDGGGARRARRIVGWRIPAVVGGAAVAGLALGALPGGRVVPGAGVLAFAELANAGLARLQAGIVGVTRAFSDLLLTFALEPLRQGLLAIPWWLLIALVAIAAWRVVGPGLAAFAVVAFLTTGLVGMWPEAMNTASQIAVAATLAVLIGLPIGVAAALSDPVERLLRPVLDTLQTMPAFVYLIPVVALFGIGRVPGIVATVVYALPPLVRLTSAGIRNLPEQTLEAARSTGCTCWQLLRTVQLPLARPQILLGVNQTIMMSLASIVIAGLIGAGGLGIETVLALTRGEVGRGIEAALAIVLLGIVLDRVTQAFGSDSEQTRAVVKTA